MKRKQVVAVLLLSFFGVAFSGMAENEMREALKVFNPGWLETAKAVLVGLFLGQHFVSRMCKVIFVV
jgi:hypothetical protein